MRAIETIQEKLEAALGFMHSKQRAALWRVVHGLLEGQQLWLTELGRNLPGACAIKHRIKAVDRFIGSPAMQAAVPKIYAALASFLLRTLKRPVLLVDWTGAESGLYVLSAKVAFAGRALTILSRTYPEKKKANPDVERVFLSELKTIIPSHCCPVLVTDAGFLFKWVDSVRACGWDYVGRARLKKMIVRIDGRCMRLHEAYELASGSLATSELSGSGNSILARIESFFQRDRSERDVKTSIEKDSHARVASRAAPRQQLASRSC